MPCLMILPSRSWESSGPRKKHWPRGTVVSHSKREQPFSGPIDKLVPTAGQGPIDKCREPLCGHSVPDHCPRKLKPLNALLLRHWGSSDKSFLCGHALLSRLETHP